VSSEPVEHHTRGDRLPLGLVEIRDEISTLQHGRVPRELRARHVVAEAELLLCERGYHAMSMDELARRVGISKPVIYDLVGSKEELFAAVTSLASDELAVRLSGALNTASHPRERLHAGAFAFFEWVSERDALWSSVLASQNAPVSSAVAKLRGRQAALVLDALAGGTSDPDVLSALAPVAHAVNGAFEALAWWWRDHRDYEAADLADMVTRLVTPGLLDIAMEVMNSRRPGGLSLDVDAESLDGGVDDFAAN
jgi:AcrR family transcriptional regulator